MPKVGSLAMVAVVAFVLAAALHVAWAPGLGESEDRSTIQSPSSVHSTTEDTKKKAASLVHQSGQGGTDLCGSLSPTATEDDLPRIAGAMPGASERMETKQPSRTGDSANTIVQTLPGVPPSPSQSSHAMWQTPSTPLFPVPTKGELEAALTRTTPVSLVSKSVSAPEKILGNTYHDSSGAADMRFRRIRATGKAIEKLTEAECNDRITVRGQILVFEAGTLCPVQGLGISLMTLVNHDAEFGTVTNAEGLYEVSAPRTLLKNSVINIGGERPPASVFLSFHVDGYIVVGEAHPAHGSPRSVAEVGLAHDLPAAVHRNVILSQQSYEMSLRAQVAVDSRRAEASKVSEFYVNAYSSNAGAWSAKVSADADGQAAIRFPVGWTARVFAAGPGLNTSRFATIGNSTSEPVGMIEAPNIRASLRVIDERLRIPVSGYWLTRTLHVSPEGTGREGSSASVEILSGSDGRADGWFPVGRNQGELNLSPSIAILGIGLQFFELRDGGVHGAMIGGVALKGSNRDVSEFEVSIRQRVETKFHVPDCEYSPTPHATPVTDGRELWLNLLPGTEWGERDSPGSLGHGTVSLPWGIETITAYYNGNSSLMARQFSIDPQSWQGDPPYRLRLTPK